MTEHLAPARRLHAVRRHRLVALAALAYVTATAVGVAMRLALVGLDVGLPFDHLLHAHSHTLYFGWAAVGVLVGAIDVVPGAGAALARTALALAVSFPVILVGFLAFGYNAVTIAISTVLMGGWYVAVWLWWRAARRTTGTGVTLFRCAFGYLVASSGGVWVLGYLQASGTGTTITESLAIHAFLLGFAWFLVLGVVGVIVSNATELGLSLSDETVRRALAWWVPLAFLTFPLGVTGGPEVAGLGPLARAAGLLLLYPGWLWASALWKGARPARYRIVWRGTAVWFAATSVATALVAVFGSETLVLAGRQGIVVYLHMLLVGFVTTSLFLILKLGGSSPTVLFSHNAALAVMLAGLVVAAIGMVETGFWLAVIGAVLLWVVGAVWAASSLSRAPH